MEIIKEIEIEGRKIRLIKGDITESSSDAIVNAANSYLKHGGGVARAIVKKGGEIIQKESDKIAFVPVGDCAITSAGRLKAKAVIHAVGPRWGEGAEEKKLKNAVRRVLHVASEKGFSSISMPAISAGIFGFPKDLCASIILNEIADFIKGDKDTSIKEINLYLIDDELLSLFERELDKSLT
jgi:O-acetyl-ADP-ribose deacetylase (regulator of RNase III)